MSLLSLFFTFNIIAFSLFGISVSAIQSMRDFIEYEIFFVSSVLSCTTVVGVVVAISSYMNLSHSFTGDIPLNVRASLSVRIPD